MAIKTGIDILKEVREFVNTIDEPEPPRNFQCPCCDDWLKTNGECRRFVCEARKQNNYTHCCNSTCHPERWK